MKKSNILIVEDEIVIAKHIEIILTDLDYQICAKVTSGEAAIRNAAELKPDLILMDIHLDGEMTGIQAAEKINSAMSTPIIFLTAYTDDETIIKAKTALPSAFLIKPVQKRLLKANIEMALYISEMDTQRRQSEKQLRESESRLRSLMDNSPDYIIELDEELRIQFINRPFPGATLQQIIGATLHSRMRDKGTQSSVKDVLNNVLISGEPAILESEYQHPDGKILTFESHAFAIRLADSHKSIGIIVSTRDLTGQKRTEIKLRKRDAWLNSTFEQAAVGIIYSNPEGRFLRVNQRYCDIMGYSSEELKGMKYTDITHPDDIKPYELQMDRLNKGKEASIHLEKRNIRKDGSYIWVNLTISTVRDEKGQYSYLLGIVENISERIKAKHKQIDLENLLQQTQKMEAIGTLAGGVAHDFNNILHPIIGFATLGIRKTSDTSSEHNYFYSIRKAAVRAKELVKQILAFSRQNVPSFEPVKLQPVINEALDMLHASIPTTIQIEADISPLCKPVRADVTQIHQIVMNLATNAYHAMQEKGGVLKISFQPEVLNIGTDQYSKITSGNYVCLRVSDTGIGISPDLIGKIFDPYFSTKDKSKGTGLGLAVVLGIINNHNGDIRVSSQPGQGTEFTIYLPESLEKAKTAVSGPATPDLSGKEHILVIDDETEIVYFHSEALKQLGYTVTGISSSLEALKVFTADPAIFDLVLTDMTMPKLTGFDLALQLLETRPDIPIILITGHNENIDEERAVAAGIRRFLYKPIDQDDLASAIRSILNQT